SFERGRALGRGPCCPSITLMVARLPWTTVGRLGHRTLYAVPIQQSVSHLLRSRAGRVCLYNRARGTDVPLPCSRKSVSVLYVHRSCTSTWPLHAGSVGGTQQSRRVQCAPPRVCPERTVVA